MKKGIFSFVLGIVLGNIAARYLFVGSVLTLIPWSIAGISLGVWNHSYRQAAINGLLYGFFLSMSFLIADYTGLDPVATKLPGFVALSIIGAIGGIVLALIGRSSSALFKHQSPE